MNYSGPPRGSLADVNGPFFYIMLRPLIERLVPAWEIELNKAWITTDGNMRGLVELLLRRLNELFDEIQSLRSANQDFAMYEKILNAQIVRLEREAGDHQELHQRISDLQDQALRMQTEIDMCRKHPIIVERSYDEDVILPQTVWMTEWRARPGFETQAIILRIIGETGLGRMPLIKERAAWELNYQSASAGGIAKAVDALQNRGLLTLRTAEKGMQGRPPKLGRLTDLGQAAYVMLTNKPPVRSELDTQSSHVSDAHMLLNLEAEGWLKKAGYEILSHGHRHYLDGVRQAVPDLTVRKNEEIFYIEVERSGKKSSRPEKWVNLCELTGGNIYVFCQYERNRETIANEVTKALLERGMSCRLSLTSQQELKQGWRGPGDSIWIEEIEIFPGMILPDE